MDQHMKQWLEQNGHQNVFAFYTQEQCEDLVFRLSDQLATEEKLEQAAREVLKQSHLTLQTLESEDTRQSGASLHQEEAQEDRGQRSTNRTEPVIAEPGGSSGQSPTLTVRKRSGWLPISLFSALALMIWSTAFYQFGFKRGEKKQAVHATAPTHCISPGRSSLAFKHHTSLKAGDAEKLPQFTSPLLIQPSLRVEISSSARTDPGWKSLESSPWKDSGSTTLLEASRLTQSLYPDTKDDPWETSSTPRLLLKKRRSRSQAGEFFRLTPLQLTRTSF